MTRVFSRLQWTTVAPVLALVLLAFTFGGKPGVPVLIVVAVFLIAAVLAAVHHAEVVAHKVGEPFGSLVLAVAVTVIEVGLIVTLMVSGDKDTSELARDTVFAAVMISINGIVGIALLVSAVKHHLANFNPEGTGAALATVVALATLCLVLPTFTTSKPGQEFSGSQLTFAAIASAGLYILFVFTQTIRHRDFFLPVDSDGNAGREARELAHSSEAKEAVDERSEEHGTVRDLDGDGHADAGREARELASSTEAKEGVDERSEDHADPPSGREALTSLGLLLVALVGVVGLAKVASPSIEDAVDAVGAPQTVVGVIIALLVLLPESIAAVRNAQRERVQVSLNLGYGSAMASIGLTIPTLAVATIWLDGPLTLGLDPTQIVLLVVSVVVGTLTVVPGRAKPLQGGLHLALLAAFVFLSISP